MDTRNLIIYYAIKYKSNFESMTRAIMMREPAKPMVVTTAVSEEVDEEKGVKILTALDSYGYPNYLQNELKPNLVMFYRGCVELLGSQDSNIGLILSDDSVDEFDDDKITRLLMRLIHEGRNLVVLGHQKMREPLFTVISRAILMGVRVIYVRDAEIMNSDYLMDKIVASKGLVISLFSSAILESDEETRKMSGEFINKICKKIIVGNVNVSDNEKLDLVSSALEMHRSVEGFEIGSESSANDAIIKSGAIDPFEDGEGESV